MNFPNITAADTEHITAGARRRTQHITRRSRHAERGRKPAKRGAECFDREREKEVSEQCRSSRKTAPWQSIPRLWSASRSGGGDSEIIDAQVNAGRFELARCADGQAAQREFAAMIPPPSDGVGLFELSRAGMPAGCHSRQVNPHLFSKHNYNAPCINVNRNSSHAASFQGMSGSARRLCSGSQPRG